MKTIFTTAFLILMLSVSLFSEKLILIQGAYLATGKTLDLSSENETATTSEFGFSITHFTGNTFGFYSSAAFLIPSEQNIKTTADATGEVEETTNNLHTYNSRVGFDALLGVGYNTHINNVLSILIGTGVHFNGLILIDDSSYYSYVLGPGVSANLLIHLSKGVNFNIGAMGAWDFIEFYRLPEFDSGESYTGGFTFSISTGMGFSY